MLDNIKLIGYLIYLPVVFTITTYVSHVLFKNSKTFMMDIFHQETEIALSTNKLFKIGFYLINLGFAFTLIELYSIDDFTELAEKLSIKIGGFTIYLGLCMLLFIIFFLKGRKAARQSKVQQILNQNEINTTS
ncbi:MAG: hypothetical protein ACPG6V_08060 [Flavobacteriales bacterium]